MASSEDGRGRGTAAGDSGVMGREGRRGDCEVGYRAYDAWRWKGLRVLFRETGEAIMRKLCKWAGVSDEEKGHSHRMLAENQRREAGMSKSSLLGEGVRMVFRLRVASVRSTSLNPSISTLDCTRSIRLLRRRAESCMNIGMLTCLRETGEYEGPKDGFRIDKNSSSASDGKTDLGRNSMLNNE